MKAMNGGRNQAIPYVPQSGSAHQPPPLSSPRPIPGAGLTLMTAAPGNTSFTD